MIATYRFQCMNPSGGSTRVETIISYPELDACLKLLHCRVASITEWRRNFGRTALKPMSCWYLHLVKKLFATREGLKLARFSSGRVFGKVTDRTSLGVRHCRTLWRKSFLSMTKFARVIVKCFVWLLWHTWGVEFDANCLQMEFDSWMMHNDRTLLNKCSSRGNCRPSAAFVDFSPSRCLDLLCTDVFFCSVDLWLRLIENYFSKYQ